MNYLLRLIAVVGLLLVGVLLFALGMARNTTALLAPIHVLLFVISLAVYLLPTALALYRDCRATVWIVAVNVLLGWTVLGWFVAIGWAAGGKVRELPPTFPAPPTHAVPSH